MHIGVSGEVRLVVTGSDGVVTTDTGFQKNLILNQGLNFFGGGNGTDMFSSCVIGSGNSTPVNTQVALDSVAAIASGTHSSFKYDYVDDGSGFYKTNRVSKYSFTGLNNVNISEVGLVSNGTTTSNYYLCTRALIKDSSGSPTAVTIRTGETLDVYYKVWQVFSITDVNRVVNMLDGAGGSVAYNTKLRMASVGSSDYSFSGYVTRGIIGAVTQGLYASSSMQAFTQDISVVITGKPSGTPLFETTITPSYVAGSYKITFTASVPVAQVGSVRSVLLRTTMGNYQVRYGSVTGDNPIPKTNKETLSIPFEISWGRYEGVL